MVACAAQGKADGSPRLQPAGMHSIRKNTQKGASGCRRRGETTLAQVKARAALIGVFDSAAGTNPQDPRA